jgi:hypothetical protein
MSTRQVNGSWPGRAIPPLRGPRLWAGSTKFPTNGRLVRMFFTVGFLQLLLGSLLAALPQAWK